MMKQSIVAAALLTGFIASTATAADLLTPLEAAVNCAPRATNTPRSADALRIVGGQDPVTRSLFGSRDLLVIDGGKSKGVQLGQQFFIRPATNWGVRERAGAHAGGTSGWLTVVAVDDTTAIAQIAFACDAIFAGDYLEPYVEPVLPAGINKVDRTGELDFSSPAHVLVGVNDTTASGVGAFIIADVGGSNGAEPGARFAVYRDLQQAGVPLTAIGEGVVVSVAGDRSVVRLTLTRDAVQSGDLLVPRRP